MPMSEAPAARRIGSDDRAQHDAVGCRS